MKQDQRYFRIEFFHGTFPCSSIIMMISFLSTFMLIEISIGNLCNYVCEQLMKVIPEMCFVHQIIYLCFYS